MFNIDKYDKTKYNIVTAIAILPEKPLGDNDITVVFDNYMKFIIPSFLIIEPDREKVKAELCNLLDNMFDAYDATNKKPEIELPSVSFYSISTNETNSSFSLAVNHIIETNKTDIVYAFPGEFITRYNEDGVLEHHTPSKYKGVQDNIYKLLEQGIDSRYVPAGMNKGVLELDLTKFMNYEEFTASQREYLQENNINPIKVVRTIKNNRPFIGYALWGNKKFDGSPIVDRFPFD